MIEARSPERVILLGDLWHAKAGKNEDNAATFAQWRQQFSQLEVVLVEGNHDLRAGKLEPALNIQETAAFQEGPFHFVHAPGGESENYEVAGHIHPCVWLTGRAQQRARLACFWFGRRGAVLPAFGEFTGCAEIRPKAGDSVYVVAGNRVMPVRGA